MLSMSRSRFLFLTMVIPCTKETCSCRPHLVGISIEGALNHSFIVNTDVINVTFTLSIPNNGYTVYEGDVLMPTTFGWCFECSQSGNAICNIINSTCYFCNNQNTFNFIRNSQF